MIKLASGAGCRVTNFLPLQRPRSPRGHHGRSDDLAMTDFLVPASAGRFRTGKPMFVGLLSGVVLVAGALTSFPAVSLGPLAE